MAIADQLTAYDMGHTFAEAIRGEQAVRQLWVRRHRGYLELWLLTAPTEPEIERQLYAAGVDLQREFPDADIDLHILNPRYADERELAEMIPPDAEKVPLSTP